MLQEPGSYCTVWTVMSIPTPVTWQMAASDSTRQRILNAAAELVRTEGSAHLSLNAVAARAGISKGGLLYNFPTKSALLKALVQQYIEEFDATLEKRLNRCGGASLTAEYLDLAMQELCKPAPPPSGLLAALSEDPSLLAPVRSFNRRLLDQMKSRSMEEAAVLLLFLVLEGMRAQKLFGTDILTVEERALVLRSLSTMMKL